MSPTHTPRAAGGWAVPMFIIPITLNPLVPDGFPGTDDAWHYHDDLCIWNNANAVQENTLQADCLSRPGNPVWIEKAGGLLHLWGTCRTPSAHSWN